MLLKTSRCKFILIIFISLYIVFHLVAVKNEDILENDDASHFKLARSVLKIASFEFANLQYFNFTFVNLKIVWLVLNVKCEIVIVSTVINKKYSSPCRLYLCAYK